MSYSIRASLSHPKPEVRADAREKALTNGWQPEAILKHSKKYTSEALSFIQRNTGLFAPKKAATGRSEARKQERYAILGSTPPVVQVNGQVVDLDALRQLIQPVVGAKTRVQPVRRAKPVSVQPLTNEQLLQQIRALVTR